MIYNAEKFFAANGIGHDGFSKRGKPADAITPTESAKT
jgi:hypothetical protein